MMGGPDPASAAARTAPLKLDPESLVLRGRPPLATRFKRGMIIGAAALGTGSVATLAYVALRPHVHKVHDDPSDMSQPAGPGNPEALNALPSSYSSVPKLGPPLPGDLGKPILDQQRMDAASEGAGNQQQAEEADRVRRASELRSARASALLVQTAPSAGTPSATTPVASPVIASGEVGGGRPSLEPSTDPNGQFHKADFVRTSDTGSGVNPHSLKPAASPYLLSAGSVIAGSLITGLRSDLPGLVTAQVTQSAYDSATGRILLIPQGARLIGTYDSVVAFGQRRALIVWQRIVLPDGSSLSLDNVPATDPSGYSGLEDKVDFHSWALLKGVAISTLLGIGAELQFTGTSDLVEAVRQSTQQNVSRAGDQLTSRALDIQPTITIRPGAPVRLLVQRDLLLRPWLEYPR